MKNPKYEPHEYPAHLEKEAMPICLKHNAAHKKKYPYKSCYYNDDLEGGAKGSSQRDIPMRKSGDMSSEVVPSEPAQPPCRIKSCGWNHGGECLCPRT